jgi:hypothetical protein
MADATTGDQPARMDQLRPLEASLPPLARAERQRLRAQPAKLHRIVDDALDGLLRRVRAIAADDAVAEIAHLQHEFSAAPTQIAGLEGLRRDAEVLHDEDARHGQRMAGLAIGGTRA